jgi:hypothetical protein
MRLERWREWECLGSTSGGGWRWVRVLEGHGASSAVRSTTAHGAARCGMPTSRGPPNKSTSIRMCIKFWLIFARHTTQLALVAHAHIHMSCRFPFFFFSAPAPASHSQLNARHNDVLVLVTSTKKRLGLVLVPCCPCSRAAAGCELRSARSVKREKHAPQHTTPAVLPVLWYGAPSYFQLTTSH